MAGSETARGSNAPASTGAARIVQMALREDCSVEELGALAASDPGLSVRILGLVNSPAFRVRQEVHDVPRAVAVLGLRGLRNLALSLVVSEMVPPGRDGDVLLANCLRRAVAAREVAERLGERDPSAHFTNGLLLDVGLLVRAVEDTSGAADLARSPAFHRMLQERASGGQPHPAAGGALAREYGLPDGAIEAIELHHHMDVPASVESRVAWVAERVAAVFEGGNHEKNVDAAVAAAEVVGLTREQVDEVLAVVPEGVTEASRGFQREVGPQVEMETLVADATRSLVAMNHQYEQLVRTLETVISDKERLMVELQRANAQLTELATTDALTGLPNKRALEESLARDLSRAGRDETSLAVVVVDVDFFKKVNDTWGHATGDDVLRRVAGVLREGTRDGDVPARYGGEEFVVVLPRADREGAHLVAERLRAALAATEIPGPSGVIRVTASFGVALATGDDHPGSLFERADAALYEAKRSGRNRVVVAD